MRAASKTILFSRVTVDKKVRQHPVAVFPNERSAKAYAGLLFTAAKSGNTEFAKALDAQTVTDDKGDLVPGIKFSLVSAPYDPVPGTGEEDLFGESASAAE